MTRPAPPQIPMETSAVRSLRRYYVLGLLSIATMFGGFGGWAAIAEISGGVIAPGSIAVEGSTKKVQHLDGGIVSQIRVKNADIVETGQELITLDGTDVRAQLQIVSGQIEELRARRARLIAERDQKSALKVELAGELSDPVRDLWAGQKSLFTARFEARVGRENQQFERIAQLDEVYRGTEYQRDAKEKQIAFIADELDGLAQLEEKQLVTKTKVLALRREQAKLEGERGQLVAEMAKIKVQISETRLLIAEQRQTFLSEVLAELREVETKLAELSEREIAASTRLKRLSIVAPQSGIVHKLVINTVGGVIAPGEAVMEIVPREQTLLVDGQLDPVFVEQVKAGQSVLLRLIAFDQQSTPELQGTVQSVSADVRQDSPQAPRYYAVRVTFNEGEIAKLNAGGLATDGRDGSQATTGKLVIGMPVEMIIKRVDRTVLSYLVKPLTDQLAHTFKER